MAVVTLPGVSRPVGASHWPGWPARALRTVLLGLVFALLASNLFRADDATPAPSLPAPKVLRRWVDIVPPTPFFALDAPEFGNQPSIFAAQRYALGSGRRDILSFGQFDGGATPYLHLSLYRIGSEATPPADFFLELARTATEAALALTRSEQPTLLATRFGDFEVADIVLARGAAQAACLGFRLRAARPGFDAAGFACGSPSEPPARKVLACTLDRLKLVTPGGDRDLDQFFAITRPELDLSCGDGRASVRPAPQNARRAKRVLKSTDRTKKASG
jgi:hypothetical protein